MTRCVILQPSYIPWVGVFELMSRADIYIHYDDVQYDKNGWRNRNRLKFPESARWLSIPVSLPQGSLKTAINEVEISDSSWELRHKRLIIESLGQAPHFCDVAEEILPALYHAEHLVDVTIPLLELMAELFGLQVRFFRSSELSVSETRTSRLVNLCQQVGASSYLSGPSAQEYLDEGLFEAKGIDVEWMDYRCEPYPQLHGRFNPNVSAIDAVANIGCLAMRERLAQA